MVSSVCRRAVGRHSDRTVPKMGVGRYPNLFASPLKPDKLSGLLTVRFSNTSDFQSHHAYSVSACLQFHFEETPNEKNCPFAFCRPCVGRRGLDCLFGGWGSTALDVHPLCKIAVPDAEVTCECSCEPVWYARRLPVPAP